MEQERILFAMPSLHLHIRNMTINRNKPLRGTHIHKEIELVHVESGRLLCTVNDREIYLDKGQFILINSKTIHHLSFCGEETSITYFQIDTNRYANMILPASETYLSLFIGNNHLKQFEIFDNDSELGNIFRALKSEINNQKRSYETYIKAEIFRLVAFMCRNSFLMGDNFIEKPAKITKILPALKYIDSNYSSKLSLEEICQTLNVNKYYFCKLFKEATGSTVVEYINFLRLYNAESLLIKTNQNISEIAFECGFSSIQHFNKLFKNHSGYTPRDYRKLLAK